MILNAHKLGRDALSRMDDGDQPFFFLLGGKAPDQDVILVRNQERSRFLRGHQRVRLSSVRFGPCYVATLEMSRVDQWGCSWLWLRSQILTGAKIDDPASRYG